MPSADLAAPHFRSCSGIAASPRGRESRFAQHVVQVPGKLPSVNEPKKRTSGSPPSSGRVQPSMGDSISNDPLLSEVITSRESVESLQEEMALLTRAGGMAAFDVFRAVSRLRDETRSLAEHTRRPGILTDLYAVIGQGTSLMASTAFDLGRWDEAAALARASTRYADLAGHASLKAWTYGLQMTLANWRNEPDTALTYYARGMRLAPAGEPRFRLRHIASRSYALLGDGLSVSEVLQAAQRDQDGVGASPDDLSKSVGGEFAFSEARAAACAAAAWLDLGNGAEAAKNARAALASYVTIPVPRRPYSQINGTQIDIAAGHLHMGDLDGAHAALCEVLDLPTHKRNISLIGRLTKVRDLLSAPPWNADSEARQLAERVSEWLACA
jgi:hypothetical protein